VIYELAAVQIRTGDESTFEERVALAAEIFLEDPACHGVELLRSIEAPCGFRLRIGWDSVAAHERFRTGDGFRRWRALVGPLLDGTPVVEHARKVVSSLR